MMTRPRRKRKRKPKPRKSFGSNSGDSVASYGNRNPSFTRFQVTASGFSGPLPPPNVLQSYDEILPGAADRIIRMAEEQANHRRAIEASVIAANVESQKVGQRYALIIALGILALGAYLVWKGQTLWGLGVVGAVIVALVSVYVAAQRSQKEERVEKWKVVHGSTDSDET